jgi:hypothetical protein
MDLKAQLLKERLEGYVSLRGGYPVPLAGAIYWAALAAYGMTASLYNWNIIAFITSGLIFPLAVALSKLLRRDFMKAKGPVDGVLPGAFIAMLLFWPGCIAAFYVAPELVSLILAIGMSGHWPTIGWSYGRPVIFAAHAIVRAFAVTAIWALAPEHRLTLIPAAVAIIYVLSVIAIYVDSGTMAKKLRAQSASA